MTTRVRLRDNPTTVTLLWMIGVVTLAGSAAVAITRHWFPSAFFATALAAAVIDGCTTSSVFPAPVTADDARSV